MDIPWIRGRVATQAHVGLPEGTVEEEYGRSGFFGRYAHLYRTEAPTGWSRIEGPLRPRAFDLERVKPAAPTSEGARVGILGNEDVRICVERMDAPTPWFVRNADVDELHFIHVGQGILETDFGPLFYEPGDYLLLPRGTTHRWAPRSPTWSLVTEARSEVTFPERGMLGQHALFDPSVVRVPSPEGSMLEADARGEWEVRIRRLGTVTRVYYPFQPLNVVGWKGTTAACQLNVRDIRPVLSDRYHLPPSAHTTFVMQGAVVCTFAPRPLENGDATALKVPFYHANIDYDEVLFYHAGEFFSRAGIKAGMLTLHPQGIHHGPQPRAVERSREATRTNEVAVMIDTRRPLAVLDPLWPSENPDYWQSWSR